MELQTHMIKIVRKLLMLFYRTYHEEKGFTSDIYKNVCAAIVHRMEYGVPPEPADETPWLMALVKYVEEMIGQKALEERRYMLREVCVAQELILKKRSYDKATWEWPRLLDELAHESQFGERVGVTTDPRHASPLPVDQSTPMLLSREVEALIHKHLDL
ncbi:hypothetical protein GSI_08928 [Ganoderma sinense ZZ0214-1]|uniref:Uncharacterized protein n=1 Tax=Ganoderma sinense ZZ0214-1 TaxID=1077348 RepID=A0A2G8S535_9APHY|nr:hypothetical protein GSI_08928 [Ganoderma sinense ZZ0214-1]